MELCVCLCGWLTGLYHILQFLSSANLYVLVTTMTLRLELMMLLCSGQG